MPKKAICVGSRRQFRIHYVGHVARPTFTLSASHPVKAYTLAAIKSKLKAIICRPPIASELERKAQRQLRTGTGILKVAKMVGLGTGTVHRIKREMNAG
jgi:hypothetical protein